MSDVMEDFLNRYKSISNKLKKRFLRKLNVSEPSDQFGALAVDCERAGVNEYAGLCQIGVGRCEAALGHNGNAAWAFRTAGRNLLKCDSLPMIMTHTDKFEGALSCFNECNKLWKTDIEMPLKTGVLLESASAFEMEGDYHQACTYYSKASDTLITCPPQQLPILSRLLSCTIKAGDYEDALMTANDLVSCVEVAVSVPFGVYSDILLRCEVTRVLLVLLLRPPALRLSPILGTLLEKYTWQNQPPVKWLDEELFLLLQSLALACQAQDGEALRETEGQLWPYLNSEQKTIMKALIETVGTND